MSELVTLDAARFAMAVGSEVSDDDLAELLDTATVLVEDFLGFVILGEDGWASIEDVPPTIGAAIKVVALDLFENRNTPLTDMTSVRALVGRYQRLRLG